MDFQQRLSELDHQIGLIEGIFTNYRLHFAHSPMIGPNEVNGMYDGILEHIRNFTISMSSLQTSVLNRLQHLQCAHGGNNAEAVGRDQTQAAIKSYVGLQLRVIRVFNLIRHDDYVIQFCPNMSELHRLENLVRELLTDLMNSAFFVQIPPPDFMVTNQT